MDIKTLIYIELITSNKKYSKRRKITYMKITWIKKTKEERENVIKLIQKLKDDEENILYMKNF